MNTKSFILTSLENAMLMIHSELMSLKCSYYIWLVSRLVMYPQPDSMFHFVYNMGALLLAKGMCKNKTLVSLFSFSACTAAEPLFLCLLVNGLVFGTMLLYSGPVPCPAWIMWQ